jgi:hypothetical protein
MKWLKVSLVVVLLVAALYVAYGSFESSFNPRRGQEGKSGNHPMTAEMKAKMAEINAKKRQQSDQEAGPKKPDSGKGKETGEAKSSAQKPDKAGGE